MTAYDRPVTIQRLDPDTEAWADWARVHARVNKARSSQYADQGAQRTTQALSFRFRWFDALRAVPQDMQSFRLVYEGVPYAVASTDDYMQRHRVFEVEGESYGV